MFVRMLLDEEKPVFLKLLVFLASVDGEITDAEIAYIKALAVETGENLSRKHLNVAGIELKALLEGITNPISKNIVILELINLALKDNNYSKAEREGIKRIAEYLGIDEAKIFQIESWVKEGIEWANKGIEIIN